MDPIRQRCPKRRCKETVELPASTGPGSKVQCAKGHEPRRRGVRDRGLPSREAGPAPDAVPGQHIHHDVCVGDMQIVTMGPPPVLRLL
ncbi:MAG: hypothetical protein M5U28_35395 [Sandaracinaceae bacterium]|nr:hypothetical protein [Sandaracinaceae bacterium]